MIKWTFSEGGYERKAFEYPLERAYALWNSLNSVKLAERSLNDILSTMSRLRKWESLKAEAAKIGALEEDWDGYGAAKVAKTALENTLQAIEVFETSGLPIPEISPTAAGTISLSWEFGSKEAYLEIGNTRYAGYIRINQQAPILLEGRAEQIDLGLIWPIVTTIGPTITTPPALAKVKLNNYFTDERLVA